MRWTRRQQRPYGAILSLDQLWALARWFADDPRDPTWRWRRRDEARAFLDSLGLTAPFWSLD